MATSDLEKRIDRQLLIVATARKALDDFNGAFRFRTNSPIKYNLGDALTDDELYQRGTELYQGWFVAVEELIVMYEEIGSESGDRRANDEPT